MNLARQILLVSAAVAAAAYWVSTHKAKPAATDGTGISLADAYASGGSIGQIGSNVSLTDTKGDALAAAVASILGTGGAGQLSFKSPEFTLDAVRLDMGKYTAITPVTTQADIAAAYKNHERVIQMGTAFRHGGPQAFSLKYVTVGGAKPDFNPANPSTFVIV